VARVAAAAAVAAALGVSEPLAAALIIVPALDFAGLLPLTPGNVGIASGAVAVALQAHGVDTTTALGAGIAFHAVETIVGVACGLTGLAFLLGAPAHLRRLRPGLAAAVCVAAAAVGSMFAAGLL
jgi:hypothetical protein